MSISPALTAKLVSIAVIFLGSLCSGLLPAFRVFKGFPRFLLSLILCYGGGILIATSLVHILPEAREGWPKDTKFSAEMSLCVGIFFVYIVEEIAHFLVCHDLHSPLGHSGVHGDEHHTHGVHVHHDDPPNRCDEPAAVFLFAEEKTRSGEHGGSVIGGLNQNSGGTCGSSGGGARCHIVTASNNKKSNHSHSHSHNSHQLNTIHQNHESTEPDQDTGDNATAKLFPQPTSPLPTILSSSKDNENNEHNPKVIIEGTNRKDEKAKIVAQLRSLVGLIALSVHAGLEGLSVGLGRDAGDVWYLCLAVSAHKLVIAFCLGMEIRNASLNSCTIVQTSSSASFKFRYVLFFSLMTPLGIGIGTLITELGSKGAEETHSAVVPILQTLASGTLLYVAFFEVILRERARFSGKGLIQLLFVVLGWTTMVLVEIYIGDHDHSHPENGATRTTTTMLPPRQERSIANSNFLID